MRILVFLPFFSTVINGLGQRCFYNKVIFTKGTDIEIKFNDTVNVNTYFCYLLQNSTEYIVSLNLLHKTIDFNNISSHEVDLSIPLLRFDEIQNIDQGLSFYAHNTDSVFVLLNEINIIYLINKKGTIVNRWNVNIELANHNTNYVLLHLPQIPLYYNKGKIYVMNTRMDIVVNTPETRDIYFSSVPDVILDVKKSPYSISNNTGKWPQPYHSGKSYDDFWPQRCVNKNGQLLYGYAIDHSLYLYNDTFLIKTVPARSRYVSKINPFPDDSIAHFGFKKKYWVTESRYERLISDPFHDIYYRIVSHSMKYERNDGTVNDISDKRWSVMVLNSNLEIMNEINFNPNDYTFYYIFPTPNGILISQKSNRINNGKMRFTLYIVVLK